MKNVRSLAAYLGLAYLFSWLIFALLVLNRHGVIALFPDDAAHARTLDVWHAFGGLGPGLAALAVLFWLHRREDLRAFFRSYAPGRLTAPGWVLALSPLLLFGFALLVGRAVNGVWFDIPGFFRDSGLQRPAALLAWAFPLLTYGFGEEAGWRGYALPRLQSRFSALGATLILALFWLGWHIPTFFYRYQLSGGMLAGFVLGLLAGAVWMTFVYNYTRGSLLAASLWHLTFNLVSMIASDAVVTATMSTVIMVLAVVVVVRYGGRDLSPYPRSTA